MKHLLRADLSHPLHTAVKHLSVDLGKPMNQLVIDGLVLLLRYHDRGHGLPEPEPPMPPSPTTTKKGGSR